MIALLGVGPALHALGGHVRRQLPFGGSCPGQRRLIRQMTPQVA